MDYLIPLLAGSSIGLASTGHLILLGRVTGISGIWQNTLKPGPKRLRSMYASFIAGLAASGFLLRQFLPSAVLTGPGSFVYLPTENPALLWTRLIVAALCVGFGTKIGSGCTSGHGVCGVSRLSIRSIYATATFMGTASLVSYMTGTAKLLRDTLQLPQYSSLLSAPLVNPILPISVFAAGAVSYFAISAANQKSEKKQEKVSDDQIHIGQSLTSLTSGLLFGASLGLSGMTRGDKIIQFLDVLTPEGRANWHPALALVMGGAILVGGAGVTWYKHLKASKPILEERCSLPTNTTIDAKLIGGSALFGVGWGLAGYCPGPALVDFFAYPLDLPRAVFLALSTFGMLMG